MWKVWSEHRKEEDAIDSYLDRHPTVIAEIVADKEYGAVMKDGGEVQMHLRDANGTRVDVLVEMVMLPKFTGSINNI